MSESFEFQGYLDLSKQLEKILDSTDKVMDYQEEIAQDFVDDLLKLPKPMSDIKKAGYTHLVRTFSYERNEKKKDIVVGWGKYYGRMVEQGTHPEKGKEHPAQPHMRPMWDDNEKKYVDKIRKKLNLD